MTTLETLFAVFVFCSFGPAIAFFIVVTISIAFSAFLDYLDGKRMESFRNKRKERKP